MNHVRELTLARFGNSRGIRLPSALIRKHGLENGLVLEDRGHEIVITAKGGAKKLSWEQTYQEMAAEGDDGEAWHCTVAGMSADICADQIRTISKTRLTTKLDALSQSDALALRELLTEMYGKP